MSIRKIKGVSKEDVSDPYDIYYNKKKKSFIFYLSEADLTVEIYQTEIAEKVKEGLSFLAHYLDYSSKLVGRDPETGKPNRDIYSLIGDLELPRIKLGREFISHLVSALWSVSTVRLISDASKKSWIYNGWLYKSNREYEDDEARLLILEEIDKERQTFERLKRKFDIGLEQRAMEGRRERIPEKVRIEVWRRDEGKCARCGSQQNLEYDHIIPVSKGGSNTVRNIQLLCEKCNREKGTSIQ